MTRGDVQGLPQDIQLTIYTKENCVLVHPGQCHIEAATKEGQRKCVLQLLEFEGAEAVGAWLSSMKKDIPPVILGEALGLIGGIGVHKMRQP